MDGFPSPTFSPPSSRSGSPRRAILASVAVTATTVLFTAGCGPSYTPTETLGQGRIQYDETLITVGGETIEHEPNYLLVGVNVNGARTHVDPIYWTDRIDSVTTPRELFEEFELVYRTLLSHRGTVEAEAALASFRGWTRRQPWEVNNDASELGAYAPPNPSRLSSAPPPGLGLEGTLEPWFLHYWSLGS